MNTTIKIKFMKTNYLKMACFGLIMLSFTAVKAQQTTGDTTKQAEVVYGTTETGGSIKVIDNKGTIKYLQAQNGITTLTNTTNDVTTTTWQLGGTLDQDTYIDVDGQAFALDGIKLVDLSTEAPSGDATTESDHGTGTGWTILVRDEATGETKKLLATDLVSGIRVEYTQVGNAAANVAIPVTGLPVLSAGTTNAKLFVYRNGAKLRSGTDFTATADTVTITYSNTDLPMFAGDVIEIQYIK